MQGIAGLRDMSKAPASGAVMHGPTSSPDNAPSAAAPARLPPCGRD